jgi:SAM-dependent methyltransferase
MADPAQKITHWHKDAAQDQQMQAEHAYLWRHFIHAIPEHDLSTLTVLDYGCNRGGFLRLLSELKPFAKGYGVDVAADAIATAQQQHNALPISFGTLDLLDQLPGAIDIAFSHEVFYLLPNLIAHGQHIAAALKPGGVYYAAIGCHTGNPLWPSWRQLVETTTFTTAYDYSLDDYASALWTAGLTVQMRPFALQDFITITPQSYYRTAQDCLTYHSQIKTIIRAVKKA